MTILDERFKIILFHDLFWDDPLRDPNIFIVPFSVEGGDEIKFDKSIQMTRAPFVEMAMFRRSLVVVRSAFCVYVFPWKLIRFPLMVNCTHSGSSICVQKPAQMRT